MCERIVQEYRIWVEEALEVLHTLCEDVVPAGRVSEELYWQTKALFKAYGCKSAEEFNRVLLQYAAEGRALLVSVESNITEEIRIRLRRENATAILNSLQMLANYAYLAEQCADNAEGFGFVPALYKELSQLFEIDACDEVKRIRSGVVVEQKSGSGAEASIIRAYPFQENKAKEWKGCVAG